MKNVLITIALIALVAKAQMPSYLDSLVSQSDQEKYARIVETYRSVLDSNLTLKELVVPSKKDTVAQMLANFAAWLIVKKRSETMILTDLRGRELFFTDTSVKEFEKSPLPTAGKEHSPVSVVAFVTITCSVCKAVCVPLYYAISFGPLNGIATLTLKPTGASEADIAMILASRQGKFWEFFNASAQENDDITIDLCQLISFGIGIDAKTFNSELNNAEIKSELQLSREEALRNKIVSTPVLYINGALYNSSPTMKWLVEAILWKSKHR